MPVDMMAQTTENKLLCPKDPPFELLNDRFSINPPFSTRPPSAGCFLKIYLSSAPLDLSHIPTEPFPKGALWDGQTMSERSPRDNAPFSDWDEITIPIMRAVQDRSLTRRIF